MPASNKEPCEWNNKSNLSREINIQKDNHLQLHLQHSGGERKPHPQQLENQLPHKQQHPPQPLQLPKTNKRREETPGQQLPKKLKLKRMLAPLKDQSALSSSTETWMQKTNKLTFLR